EAKKLAPIVIAEPVMHGSAVVGGCIRVTASIAEVHVRVVTADHGGPIAPHVAVVVLASAEPGERGIGPIHGLNAERRGQGLAAEHYPRAGYVRLIAVAELGVRLLGESQCPDHRESGCE